MMYIDKKLAMKVLDQTELDAIDGTPSQMWLDPETGKTWTEHEQEAEGFMKRRGNSVMLYNVPAYTPKELLKNKPEGASADWPDKNSPSYKDFIARYLAKDKTERILNEILSDASHFFSELIFDL